MAVSSLQPLLEGAGLDALVTHVLPLLSPHDLGRLACASRRLRAVVADVPESTWQAAAWRTYPHQQHPIHCAASCQAYLRRQHATHAAISSGRTSMTVAAGPRHAQLAPDLTRHAALRETASGGHFLQLLDVATQHEVARFELPPLQFRQAPSWDLSSSRIALTWGADWISEYGQAPVASGVCIVHVLTGNMTQAALGPQPTCPIFGGFNPGGSALVFRMLDTEPVWTVLDSTGSVQCNAASPFNGHPYSRGEHLVLAPANTHAASYLRSCGAQCSSFALWHLSEGKSFHTIDTYGETRDLSWSPCSAQILTLSTNRAQLRDTQGSMLSCIDFSAQPLHASWSGSVVAFVCESAPDSNPALARDRKAPMSHLQVYKAQDASLTLSFVYELSGSLPKSDWKLGHAQVSPDWHHITVLVRRRATPEYRSSSYQLLVLSAAGHTCMHADIPGLHYHLTWAADGTAVACDMLNAAVIVRFG